MTVKMLVDRPVDGQEYKVGELCDTNDYTEAGLVAAKLATTDLTGGVAHVFPVAQVQYTPVTAMTNPLTGGIALSASDRLIPIQSPMSRFSPGWLVLAQLRGSIIANGGTVDERDLVSVRDPLDALIRSSVWPKLKELWLPIGNGYLSAMCKLKGMQTLTMTGNNLVDADFTRWLGLTGNGTSKDVVTGFNPSSLTSNWGCGVYPVGMTSPTGTKALLGDGANTYVGFAGGDSRINGITAIALPFSRRFTAVQNSSTAGSTTYCGGYQVAAGPAGVSNCTSLRLLSHGGSLYSNTSVGGYAAWSPVLTEAEIRTLSDFFEVASYNLGRLGVGNAIVACGDSNTYGHGLASPTVTRWSAILSSYLGAVDDNKGVSASAMSSSATGRGGASTTWANQQIITKTNNSGVFLASMFGTNDDRYLATITAFQSEYESWINAQISLGWKTGNIILMSPIAATDTDSSQSRLLLLRSIVANLSAKYGCIYVDTYALTLGNSSHFQGDALHLSVAGHQAVADAVMAAISSTYYSGAMFG